VKDAAQHKVLRGLTHSSPARFRMDFWGKALMGFVLTTTSTLGCAPSSRPSSCWRKASHERLRRIRLDSKGLTATVTPSPTSLGRAGLHFFLNADRLHALRLSEHCSGEEAVGVGVEVESLRRPGELEPEASSESVLAPEIPWDVLVGEGVRARPDLSTGNEGVARGDSRQFRGVPKKASISCVFSFALFYLRLIKRNKGVGGDIVRVGQGRW